MGRMTQACQRVRIAPLNGGRVKEPSLESFLLSSAAKQSGTPLPQACKISGVTRSLLSDPASIQEAHGPDESRSCRKPSLQGTRGGHGREAENSCYSEVKERLPSSILKEPGERLLK